MTTTNQRQIRRSCASCCGHSGRDAAHARGRRPVAGGGREGVGISQAYVSSMEAGNAAPSLEVILAVAAALGCDLSVRMFPGTGPRIRDRIQVAMSEALLASLHPRWRAQPEVPVYRPVRGVIDLVLTDATAHLVVPTELQSELRRVEQQIRWSVQKADALAVDAASLPATVSAACWWCGTRPPCARPSEPPPGHWPRPTRPGRPMPSRPSPPTVPGRVPPCCGRTSSAATHGSSMGRLAGSRSGDSIVRVKKIGFLSFGHWSEAPYSQVRSGSDALLQSIELAVAAEELGADGAYFRVHHFARQLASPFPLLAADRRADQADRDRHRRHRHALREPALHGRGRGRGRPHRRRPAPARHQPRVAGAGDRRLPVLRLRARRGRDRRRHGAPPRRGLPPAAQGRGLRRAEPAADVPQPAGPAPPRAAFGGAARADLVGRRLERDGGLGGEAGHEPAELDAQVRRERRAAPHPAGQADRGLPGGLEGGRPRARAARLGQPQHLRPRQRPGPGLLRARRRATRTRSATSMPTPARSSGGPTRRSPTSSSRSSPRTRRSPPPTPCC